MSVDLRLAQECSHYILEEPVTTTDRRTLTPLSPIASARSVRVTANDENIPSTGLYAQAEIVGDREGPFYVPACDRVLTVTTSTDSVTLTLAADSYGRVSPVSLAQTLSGALPQAAVTVEAGRLVIADYGSLGASSRVTVGGSAADHVGFGVQRGATGSLVYPGWQVVDGGVKFLAPLRANPVLKVSYVTTGRQCRRCSGTFVENDWQYSMQGEVMMVSNEDLLVQSALKIILTKLQSNYYHPGYGSSIMGRIGSKAVSAVAGQIALDVRTALSNLSTQQGVQAKLQAVTSKERLYAVSSVNVYPSTTDPTVFKVDVTVRNASGDPVSVSIVYTAPGAVALAGSNGLSLG